MRSESRYPSDEFPGHSAQRRLGRYGSGSRSIGWYSALGEGMGLEDCTLPEHGAAAFSDRPPKTASQGQVTRRVNSEQGA